MCFLSELWPDAGSELAAAAGLSCRVRTGILLGLRCRAGGLQLECDLRGAG